MMYLAVVIGAILILGIFFNKGYARKDFMWSKFLIKNLGQTILNIASGFTIVWLYQNQPDAYIFENFLGQVDLSKCVFYGTSGQAILTGIFQVLSKDTQTVIGINKQK